MFACPWSRRSTLRLWRQLTLCHGRHHRHSGAAALPATGLRHARAAPATGARLPHRGHPTRTRVLLRRPPTATRPRPPFVWLVVQKVTPQMLPRPTHRPGNGQRVCRRPLRRKMASPSTTTRRLRAAWAPTPVDVRHSRVRRLVQAHPRVRRWPRPTKPTAPPAHHPRGRGSRPECRPTTGQGHVPRSQSGQKHQHGKQSAGKRRPRACKNYARLRSPFLRVTVARVAAMLPRHKVWTTTNRSPKSRSVAGYGGR